MIPINRNQTIYTILRNGGMTEAGACAMMGNWDCESGLEPGRLQNDFNSFRTASKYYVTRVTSGALSKEAFATDSKGFGLAQWTLAYRKRKLWDFWKYYGTALDSEVMQTFFALKELQTEDEYAGLFQMLKTSSNLYACSDAVCENYERPAHNNFKDRREASDRILAMFAGFTVDPTAYAEYTPAQGSSSPIVQPEPTLPIMPTHEYWPPRVICEGMKGPDVEVLCALLKAQEYGVNYVDSTFGSFLTERVKVFQTENGLKPDGIVGPLTWNSLLKIKTL